MYDVIVMGGGIIGCSVAWQLSKLKQKVLVIERADVASGSAGATDGFVGCYTKKPGPQLDLAIKSVKMLDTLQEELDTHSAQGPNPNKSWRSSHSSTLSLLRGQGIHFSQLR